MNFNANEKISNACVALLCMFVLCMCACAKIGFGRLLRQLSCENDMTDTAKGM